MKRLAAVFAACLLVQGCGQTADSGAVQSIARTASELCGSWECGDYFLTIGSFAPGNYAGVLIRADGPEAAEMWEYENMEYYDGRLICRSGTRYDMDEAGIPPAKGYDTDQHAEFLLTAEGLIWRDLSQNRGAGLCFTEGQAEPLNVFD